MKSLLNCVIALSLLVSTAVPQKPTTSVYNIPPALDDGWQVANADSVGNDSKQQPRRDSGYALGISQSLVRSTCMAANGKESK